MGFLYSSFVFSPVSRVKRCYTHHFIADIAFFFFFFLWNRIIKRVVRISHICFRFLFCLYVFFLFKLLFFYTLTKNGKNTNMLSIKPFIWIFIDVVVVDSDIRLFYGQCFARKSLTNMVGYEVIRTSNVYANTDGIVVVVEKVFDKLWRILSINSNWIVKWMKNF